MNTMYEAFDEYIEELHRSIKGYVDSKVAEQYADSAQARSWDEQTQQTYLNRIDLILGDVESDCDEDDLTKATQLVLKSIPNFFRLNRN